MTDDAAVTAIGFAKCEKPARYIEQVAKHWSHKMATSYVDGIGTFPFSAIDNAVMTAQPGGIGILLITGSAERNIELRGVIERHIDRFAFREAPLSYEWKDQ